MAVGLVVAVSGYADQFKRYPDDLDIWTGRTTLRVRDDGSLTFGSDDDVSLAINASSALEIDGPVAFTEVTTSPGIIGGIWYKDDGTLWFTSSDGSDIQIAP